jgi:hypothetical protein
MRNGSRADKQSKVHGNLLQARPANQSKFRAAVLAFEAQPAVRFDLNLNFNFKLSRDGWTYAASKANLMETRSMPSSLSCFIPSDLLVLRGFLD